MEEITVVTCSCGHQEEYVHEFAPGEMEEAKRRPCFNCFRRDNPTEYEAIQRQMAEYVKQWVKKQK